MKDYLYIDSSDDANQTRFIISKTPDIDNLIGEKRFGEALDEINRIIETDPGWINWMKKAVILANMKKYSQSLECFDNALSIEKNSKILLNKANTLYDWAKVTFFPEGDYEKAAMLIECAIKTLPEEEDPSEFYFLKAEILEGQNNLVEAHKAYLTAHKQFDRLKQFKEESEYLKNTRDTLINIVGCDFYNFTPESGVTVSLVRDEENEHDSDAVAVLKDGETVGYVANNPYTLIDGVESATDLKTKLLPDQKAEIMFIYLSEYVIARLR